MNLLRRGAFLVRGLPVLVGALVFAFVWVGQAPPGVLSDFDYIRTGGQAIWHGQNPYTYVRDQIHDAMPFYYPVPAAILTAPLGALPRHLAISLFTGLGMGLLALSVQGYRKWIVLSAPAIQAVLFGQWSPWLTAAVGLPWLRVIWIAKPSIGLSLFAGWPSRLAVAGGLVLLLISLVLLPSWPVDWLDALRNGPQLGGPHLLAPVQRLGGPLLLLAFLRWREPEARLLGVLSLVPHTNAIYEQLPLLLIPRTPRSFATMMGLTYVAAFAAYWLVDYTGITSTKGLMIEAALDRQWPYFLVLVWLPALYLVLRNRSGTQPVKDEKVTESAGWSLP